MVWIPSEGTVYVIFPFTIVCFTPSIQTVKLYPFDVTVIFTTSPTLRLFGTVIVISGVILSIQDQEVRQVPPSYISP